MTLGIGTGALVAGFFGMNVGSSLHKLSTSFNSTFQLLTQFEDDPYAFYAMSAFATSLAFGVAWAGLRKWVFQNTIRVVTNNYSRLTMIRKVGLASNNSKKKPRERAWVPLPLRNRISGGWS